MRSLRNYYWNIAPHNKAATIRFRSSHRKFTWDQSCRSVFLTNLWSNFIEVTLRHVCSPVHLLHIFRIPFTKNTSERLFLNVMHINKCISKWCSKYGIFIKAIDWTRNMNYWNIGLYETNFTKTYNTVGYVKSDSTFMVLFNVNSFQCNIKFIVEGKKEKYCCFPKLYPLLQYRNYRVPFRNSIKENLLLKSNQKRNWLKL